MLSDWDEVLIRKGSLLSGIVWLVRRLVRFFAWCSDENGDLLVWYATDCAGGRSSPFACSSLGTSMWSELTLEYPNSEL